MKQAVKFVSANFDGDIQPLCARALLGSRAPSPATRPRHNLDRKKSNNLFALALTTGGAPTVPEKRLLLSSALAPVSQKLRLALISQRMVEELFDYLERHGGNVGAHACGFDHMYGMADARCQDFRFPFVVSVDVDDVLQQQQAVFADVVEPAKKGTNERRTGLGGHDRLRGREAKRHVYFDAFV